MATVLPKPKLLTSHSLLGSRSLLPVSFRLTLTIDADKPVRTSSNLCRQQRDCLATSASQWRCWSASTSGAVVLDVEKENDEEAEDFMPLREMARWLQNKPAGFGEGKTYNTEVEDNILEELDRSRKNNLEEKRKQRVSLKDNAGIVKKQEKQSVINAIKSDAEVRLGNLPKKKNIDRDLWKAFEGFPGITNISPAVTGNKKTRDPICRGFAIVGFESDAAAYRFIQKFSNQNLHFGKVQKQISCDFFNGNSFPKFPNSSQSTSSSVTEDHGNEISRPFTSESSVGVTNGIKVPEQNNEDYTMLLPNDRTIPLLVNETTQTAMTSECSSFTGGDDEVMNKDLRFNNPGPSDQNRKKIAIKKTKPTRPSRARVLGSLARLKVKERAVLTGVFSKYGEVDSSAPKYDNY